jgi:hypothetical protein
LALDGQQQQQPQQQQQQQQQQQISLEKMQSTFFLRRPSR